MGVCGSKPKDQSDSKYLKVKDDTKKGDESDYSANDSPAKG